MRRKYAHDKPAGPPPITATLLPVPIVAFDLKSTCLLARFTSPTNLLSHAMATGSSSAPLLHAVSQGWGHTLPMDAGMGSLSLIRSPDSLYIPFAIRPTYP